ncbi:SH3-like domain-containing protein [Synechococcus sp. 7002]|uniref:SH3-like domain-containing protein n=1 Tax=Synechococcus sp. 7002 TaxID=1938862 RepID=UPI001F2C7103|nr:SH3-like domain-containing protein [Synechococcus sp. 7002]
MGQSHDHFYRCHSAGIIGHLAPLSQFLTYTSDIRSHTADELQHNLGGLEGLDPINAETQVFVEPWEQRIFGIHTAMMALSNHLSDSLPDYAIEEVPTTFKSFWTWGHLRMGAEGMHPFDYFRLRYYEKWLGGISGFFISEGYITQEELDARTAELLENSEKAAAPLPDGGAAEIDAQVLKYLQEGTHRCESFPPHQNLVWAIRFASKMSHRLTIAAYLGI